jgi:tetratricopeptide (TPR) repeat protein
MTRTRAVHPSAIICPLLAALAAASAAHAAGADDANAGLDALKAGNYPQATARFTSAINSGDLQGDDKEFAYAARGRAYLKSGNLEAAIPDLDKARRMKPDDSDAQTDLIAALTAALPVVSMPGLPKPSFWGELGKSLLLGAAAGIASGLENDDQNSN